MKIGDLAKLTDTRVETIRYYEKEGLLPAPSRNSGNYRVYELQHLNRLSFIRRSRDLGFTLEQVRKLLKLADNQDASCSEVDAIATEHIIEIDRKISDLTLLRDQLLLSVDCCQSDTIADCKIIESLAPFKNH
ncbi:MULTISPECIES: helix-turn-helix domain-containing protein [Sphingomonadaceae]|jgi:Cu(I)-responsive transcriptional regulator|uniref:MerR family transcriptional regulator n=1 Tax=Sphingomonadales TaxID=204457 RepID=UPI000F5DA16C|nr:helix-turn-helix domain-containing protein [Novosphingobium sp. LASN5T]RQW41297.1 MerR family transcriptional regulator [Novosphingobium sp. LASN5T]